MTFTATAANTPEKKDGGSERSPARKKKPEGGEEE